MIRFPSLKHEKIHLIDATDMPLKAIYVESKDDKLFIKRYIEDKATGVTAQILNPTTLSNFLRQLKIKKNSNIIFLWGNKNAATFSAKVHLEKKHSEFPISQIDLQRIFGTAAFQFYNQFREDAKKRFNVDDLGLVLASSRILDLRLDGEPYINLASVKAKRADVSIEQTFLRREVHDAINETLNFKHSVLHIEVGTALYELARLSGYKLKSSLFLLTGVNSTRLYSIKPNSPSAGVLNSLLQHEGDVDLGMKNFYEVVSDRFGVRAEDFDIFLAKLNSKGASPRLNTIVKKVILAEFSKYLKEGISCMPKAENLLFFTQEPLATFLEQSNIPDRFPCIIPASLYNKDIIQPEIKFSQKLSLRALSPIFFAGLIAYWCRLGDNYLESRYQGNVKWLIPHNSI
ncbi:MAG: hypothetical protein Q8L47_04110 [bacterium]|nr:hypothetical protein [bacterium]